MRASAFLLAVALLAGILQRHAQPSGIAQAIDICPEEGVLPRPGRRCADDYLYCSAKGAAPVVTPCPPGNRFDKDMLDCRKPSGVRDCRFSPDDVCMFTGKWFPSEYEQCPTSYAACSKEGANFTITECPQGKVFNALLGDCDARENTPGCNGQAGVFPPLNDPEFVSTIFMPTNQAFFDLAKDLDVPVEALLSPPLFTEIRKVLINHSVIGEAIKLTDFIDGEVLITYNDNQTLVIDTSEGIRNMAIKPEGGPSANVIPSGTFNLCAISALAIDTVLLPSNVDL